MRCVLLCCAALLLVGIVVRVGVCVGLCCAVLSCVVLCCVALRCVVLCCVVLRCAVVCCVVLCCVVLCWFVLCRAVSCGDVLRHGALRCVVFCCVVLCCLCGCRAVCVGVVCVGVLCGCVWGCSVAAAVAAAAAAAASATARGLARARRRDHRARRGQFSFSAGPSANARGTAGAASAGEPVAPEGEAFALRARVCLDAAIRLGCSVWLCVWVFGGGGGGGSGSSSCSSNSARPRTCPTTRPPSTPGPIQLFSRSFGQRPRDRRRRISGRASGPRGRGLCAACAGVHGCGNSPSRLRFVGLGALHWNRKKGSFLRPARRVQKPDPATVTPLSVTVAGSGF